MIKFGLLKSKIETKLLESYSNKTFKSEIKNFKKLVLENKNVSKLFYLYDELNSNKGLNESIVWDYINESIVIYENTINKIKPEDFRNIQSWVSDVKTENKYENIDNLFFVDVLNLESRILSKKVITENLKKPRVEKKESINLPISAMVNIANKTISTFVEGLNESEKKELLEFFSSDDTQLKESFDQIKGDVITKLESLKENTDSLTLIKINETIEKVTSESYNKLTYFKLKNLKESL